VGQVQGLGQAVELSDGGLGRSELFIGTSHVSNVSSWDTCVAAVGRGSDALGAAPASSSSLVCTAMLSPCSQHFFILCMSPRAFHHLLPCPGPNPQPFCSLLLFLRLGSALPLPPLALQPSHHLFYTLLQLSDALLQSPGFPRSCLHVSFFITLHKPIVPNRLMALSSQHKSCSQPPNHPQAAASSLLFTGELQKTSHSQQIIVTQRFLIMYLPLPFFCLPVCGAGSVCTMTGAVVCPLGTARL